jgi:4a-hydroxytetrahydrobiopterin dehydratase
MQKYTIEEIKEKLITLPDWSYADNFISKSFLFSDFSEAFGFLTRVALISEQMNHHADWSGVYNRVTLKLSTHDAGGITDRDFLFAKKVEELLG